MKVKTIIFALLALFTASAVISCEDMLSVDSDSVIYESENKLDSPVDTVYSFLGIVQRLQAIADRTILLGELRGDLVSPTGRESDDIRELYKYDFANLKRSNKYADPMDYYAVINNCNFYLSRVDTTFVRNDEKVFLKEYISVLSLRAWTYLQLAQTYGRVYFVKEPITSASDANEETMQFLDIKMVAKELLADFEERFLDEKLPSFSLGGNTNDDGSKSQQHNSKNFILPIRLIMGDLSLWAEEYAKAAHYYHEYLFYKQNYVSTGTGTILWNATTFDYTGHDTYVNSTFGNDITPIAYIPMESEKYAGIMSDLPNIFNSTKDNLYYPQLSYSNALLNLSARQEYCYHRINAQSLVSSPVYLDKRLQENVMYKGDLRLQSIFEVKAASQDDEDKTTQSTIYNTSRQTLKKLNSEKISIYRKDVVYLRLAEALNRCEMPKTAFAILKYGLTEEFIEDSISQREKDRAAELGIPEVLEFPSQYFMSYRFQLYLSNGGTDRNFGYDSNKPVSTEYTNMITSQSPTAYNTMGLHTRGSGDAAINQRYRIKVATPGASPLMDTIRAVEEMIIDEMALETCFEGYRFGDLMRVSMHRAADTGYPGSGGFADNDFLAKRVASREGATLEDPYSNMDMDLYNRLLRDGTSFNPNWFLRLKDTKD